MRKEDRCHHVRGRWIRRNARCDKVAWKTKIKFGEDIVYDFFRDPTVDQVLRRYTISKNVENNFLSGVILFLCYCKPFSQTNAMYEFEMD